MTDAPRQVCYFADGGFVHCTLVSVLSLLETSQVPLAVTLFLDTPDDWARGRLDALVAAFPAHRITRASLPAPAEGSGQRGHISAATLARLNLPELMSGRVLHIDGDTLVRADLDPVFGTDLGQALVAGVRSEYLWRSRLAAARCWPGPWRGHFRKQAAKARIEGRDLGECYVNAGVMLYDLDRIADTPLAAQMQDADRAEAFRFRDQDLLNLVFAGRIALLAPEYNSVWGAVATGRWPLNRAERALYRAARENPAIVHFAGRRKPWNDSGGLSPARRRWVREWRLAAARLESLGKVGQAGGGDAQVSPDA